VKTLIQGPSSLICNECVAVCNRVLRGAWRQRPDFPGFDALPDAQLIAILRSSSEAERNALKVQVDALRRRRIGWATIGRALGVSRQAAWQRFA
jgi:ATP-dependent protease Clp ATPase subunit